MPSRRRRRRRPGSRPHWPALAAALARAGYLIDRGTDAACCWPRGPGFGNDSRHVVGSSPSAAQSQLGGGVASATIAGRRRVPPLSVQMLKPGPPQAAYRSKLPRQVQQPDAVFSPDGSFLAVQVSFSDDSDDGELAVQLELVATASGRLTTVPQTWVSSNALIGFGWPASSESLVAELSFTTKVQLASWHPGARRAGHHDAQATEHSPASLVMGRFAPCGASAVMRRVRRGVPDWRGRARRPGGQRVLVGAACRETIESAAAG